MKRRWIGGLITLLCAGCNGGSSDDVQRKDAPQEDKKAIETVVETRHEKHTPEEIIAAVNRAANEIDETAIAQRVVSPEYQTNPFHIGGPIQPLIECSLEEGLRLIQAVAADPIVPFRGHYFFDGTLWYNLTEDPQLTVEATGQLDSLFTLDIVSDIPKDTLDSIVDTHDRGVFASSQSMDVIVALGRKVHARVYELLGLPPEQYQQKTLINVESLGLPSPDHILAYTSILTQVSPEKQFSFCVCTATGIVYFSAEQDYLEVLRRMTPQEQDEAIRRDVRAYLKVQGTLARDLGRSLRDCIATVNETMSSQRIGFRLSLR